ncbi:hypothetical protein, partial [Pseudomonas aeruginosa]|uniref:hypothetical protein n=1 Tax=Pseudomonas aeruginosa TaxID=287 RepID=UPI0021F0BE85
LRATLTGARAPGVWGWALGFIARCFPPRARGGGPPPPPGAGSAMLATVQQASLGLGSALLGAVFAHRLERHGDYLEATQTTLAVEFVLMTLLLGATCLFYLRRVRTVPLRCDSPGN